MSPVPTLAVGGKVIPTRAWLLDEPLGWIMAVTGGRSPGRFMHSLGASGAICPLGGVERLRRVVRFTPQGARRGRGLPQSKQGQMLKALTCGFAPPAGLEPATYGLEVRCSIH